MKNRLLAWLLCLAMLLTIGAVAVAETNPNAGLGYYPGTAEKGAISVECSTMSVMNPIKMTYNTGPDGNGETIVRTYAFYQYGGGRQCFMAYNGNGSFYMLQKRVDKIISDIAKIFTPEDPIKPQAKT